MRRIKKIWDISFAGKGAGERGENEEDLIRVEGNGYASIKGGGTRGGSRQPMFPSYDVKKTRRAAVAERTRRVKNF